MAKILKSKSAGWLAFLIIICVCVLTFSLRVVWWSFFDLFFAFMMVFCHVIALTIEKYNGFASAKLEKIAMVMAVMTVVALIGEFIAFQFVTI